MEPKHLYTVRWTQPYATNHLRPYLRGLQEQMENLIETLIADSEYKEANEVIDRIKQL